MRCGLWGMGLMLWAAIPVLAGSQSGPPVQQLVRMDASGRLKVYYQMTFCIPETQTRTVQEKVPVTKEVQETVNGELRTKTVTVYETVQKQIAVTVMKNVQEFKIRDADPDDVRAFEIDGKPISTKNLAERLSEDTLVVVSSDEHMIPDYYAALFKPGTIVLAFKPAPAAAPHHAPGPVEAPPPPPERTELRGPRLQAVSLAENERQRQLRVPETAPAPSFPKTLPPRFLFAGRDGAERYKLRTMTEHSFDVTGYKVKSHGTGKQMVPVQMIQTVRNQDITSIASRDLQFYSGNGQPVPADRIKEKLSREATVAYSADGEPVDPFWLQNFKPTTLVLVGPQLPVGCGPMAMPMPAAPANAPAPALPAPAPAISAPPPPPAS